MEAIEALRTSILEPRDHLHINHERMAPPVRSAGARVSALDVVAPLPAQATGDEE
jgi:hypothetical protein